MPDRERLEATLTEYSLEFGQRGWRTETLYWSRSQRILLHGKSETRGGLDEALVVARICDGRYVQVRRYLLLHDEAEWLTCDQKAFEGFLDEGSRGLKRGTAKTKPTICNCVWRVHRSEARAQAAAFAIAARFGAPGVQRPYRCADNPRAFHLSAQQKGTGKPIPGAYIDPGSAATN